MRTEFDRAIGAVPPSGVDLDAVIGKGRRTVRVRQTWIAGGVGALVLALFLAFVPFRRTEASPLPAAPAPSASFPTPTAGKPVPASIKVLLDAVVAARLTAYAPNVVFVKAHAGSILISSYQSSAGEHSYEAVALIKTAAGTTQFRLLIFDAYPFPYSCTSTAVTGCAITDLGAGRQSYQQTGSQDPHGEPENVAAVSQADGSTVEISNSTDFTDRPASADFTWKPGKYGKPAAKPLFTAAELAEVADDPALSFHPPGT